MYKPLREDNQQGGVNTTVATVTNLEKGKARFLYLNWKNALWFGKIKIHH